MTICRTATGGNRFHCSVDTPFLILLVGALCWPVPTKTFADDPSRAPAGICSRRELFVDDWLIASEHLSGCDSEGKLIANLAGSASNSDANG